MLFHSQAFLLVFLPVVVSLYYMLARHVAAREWLIIAASAVFYAWWDVRFLPLLIGEVAIAWLVAEIYFRTGLKWLLTAGIVATLIVLGVFKYLDFFAGSLSRLIGHPVAPSGIVLPIGISFFTFQIVSYFIDAGRGDAPRYGFRRFALVILLFPHLIAGPIVRHVELVPQFDASPLRDGLAERLVRGLTLFLVGFLTKVLVADKLAPFVDEIFAVSASATPPLTQAWAGALGFALQIYFDFAAYSEMAMGLALMLGLSFPMNFNMPYRATSLQDFWRRWHMSLSRFLRDYLYIPLGGSRHGFGRFALATMTTMGLCGLWHGAGWTFILWGLFHGCLLALYHTYRRLYLRIGRRYPAVKARLDHSKLYNSFSLILTQGLVVFSLLIFGSPSLKTAVILFKHLARVDQLVVQVASGLTANQISEIATVIALAFVSYCGPQIVRLYNNLFGPLPLFVKTQTATCAVLLSWILSSGDFKPFIYFQF